MDLPLSAVSSLWKVSNAQVRGTSNKILELYSIDDGETLKDFEMAQSKQCFSFRG